MIDDTESGKYLKRALRAVAHTVGSLCSWITQDMVSKAPAEAFIKFHFNPELGAYIYWVVGQISWWFMVINILIFVYCVIGSFVLFEKESV